MYTCICESVCALLANFYTTGMTVVLMGFVLETLDCLLQCYESVNTQPALQFAVKNVMLPGQLLKLQKKHFLQTPFM